MGKEKSQNEKKHNEKSGKSSITQIGKDNLAIVNSNVTIIGEFEEIHKLLKSGRVQEASERLEDLRKKIMGKHIYAPYWYWDIEKLPNGRLQIVSKPSSKEALEKYPRKLVFKPVLPEGENIQKIVWDAYCNQKEVSINVRWFKDIIGDHIVFEQEAEEGNIRFVISPKPFPPPQPVKIYFRRGTFYLNYVELGLSKILNEHTVLLTNEKQQNRNFLVIIEMNLREKKSKFNITLEENYKNDVESVLAFYRMVLDSFNGNIQPVVQLYKTDEFLIKGEIGTWEFKSENDSVSQEEIKRVIKILEDLLEIEEYFDIKFDYPNQIGPKELQKITLLNKAIKGEKVTGKYNNMELFFHSIYDKEGFVNLIKDNNGENVTLKISPYEIDLFGRTCKFKESIITLHNAVIKDPEKIRRKLNDLEEGEVIKVVLVPVNDNQNTYEQEFIV